MHPADDDAVAGGPGFIDHLFSDLDHFVGVEKRAFGEFESGGESSSAHGVLIEAVQP